MKHAPNRSRPPAKPAVGRAGGEAGPRSARPRGGTLRARRRRGFTLVELILTVMIVSTLLALAIPKYGEMRNRALVVRAMGDISDLQDQIAVFEIDQGEPPESLYQIGEGGRMDPWGRPYQYLKFSMSKTGDPKPAGARKDRFLVPINSTYDLYSVGADGKTVPALTAKSSHDDVIRANDGRFIGLAVDF